MPVLLNTKGPQQKGLAIPTFLSVRVCIHGVPPHQSSKSGLRRMRIPPGKLVEFPIKQKNERTHTRSPILAKGKELMTRQPPQALSTVFKCS